MATSTVRDSADALAVIAGVRTPFAKSFTALTDVPADELGRVAVVGALEKAQIPAANVDELVFGNVACPADASNVARVIALRAGIPWSKPAHTVNRNCASGMEAIETAWQLIRTGRAQTVVAGGAESMSQVPLLWDERVKDWLLGLAKAKGLQKLSQLTRFRPKFLRPIPGLELGLMDPTCRLNMGQTAEILSREFAVSRTEQDEFALRSHQRATAAWARCFLKGEVVPLPLEGTNEPLAKDVGPRENQSLAALAKLKPYFEPKTGSVTPGNSCPITDGAVALVLMSAANAKAQGLKPLGYVRATAVAGCDPRRMGLGPVFAMHQLMEATGRKLSDFELFEINEAFATQVIGCQRALASKTFCERELGRANAVGEIDPEKMNVNGGAIALGHPVGASGARLVLTLIRALREKQLSRGLASLCVGGGQGMAMWVETDLTE
jgi:acetyl-CoA acetyltransferase family protein